MAHGIILAYGVTQLQYSIFAAGKFAGMVATTDTSQNRRRALVVAPRNVEHAKF